MTELATPLVLCVPSKGRLQENSNSFFARAGLDVVQARGARDYRGGLAQMSGVEIAFLSAADIVAQLASGAAHLGVTGEDLVRETLPDADARLEMLAPLALAMPMSWSPCRKPGLTWATWPTLRMWPVPSTPGAASACGWQPNMCG